MLRRHPAPATLITCAAGTLPPLHRRVLAPHIADCPACRDGIRLGEALGGALLEAAPPAALAAEALSRALARLDDGASEPIAARAPLPDPDPLATWTRGRRWRPLAVGIRLLPLVPRDATGTRLDLIRVAPGVALPQHDHRDRETTYVLAGAFVDLTGEYHAGDVAEGDAGLDHRPRAVAGGDCVCRIATTGGLRPRSLLARLLRPIFGL